MKVSRYIKKSDWRDFIREIKKYSSFRFYNDPFLLNWNREDSEYFVEYTIEVEEANKLSEFFNKIYERDNPPKVSFWQKIIKVIRG